MRVCGSHMPGKKFYATNRMCVNRPLQVVSDNNKVTTC